MKDSLQDEIRTLKRHKAEQLRGNDLILVVTAYGEPVAMTPSDLVRGVIRLQNQQKAIRPKRPKPNVPRSIPKSL